MPLAPAQCGAGRRVSRHCRDAPRGGAAGAGAGAAGSRGSLAPSGGERREAEQAIGRHAKRNVVVPARLLKLTKYVRRDVHLRLPSKSGLKCRDETQSSNDYLLHLQDRWSTLESVRRKKGNRTCDLADHVARESSPRDSDECHRASTPA